MAVLAMVESWTQSTGLRLPPLIRRLGHRYVLFAKDPSVYPATVDGPHPVLREAAEVVIVDTDDDEALAAAVARCGFRFDGALTTCDYYLSAVARLCRRLGLPGAPPEAVSVALAKHEVRAVMRAAGLPGPAYAVAGSWPAALSAAAEIGFPLVAKPVDLNSGASVRRVDDEAGLKDAFWDVASAERNSRGQPLRRLLLLEELLDGPEVSVEGVTQGGETSIMGVTAKTVTAAPAFVEAGHLFPAQLEPAAVRQVEDYVRATLAALGYTHGLSHAEVRLTAAGPRLVELNPRQGGGYIFELVRQVTGTSPLEVLVQLALGQAPAFGAHASRSSAAVAFVMSPIAGTLRAVDGAKRLAADPAVREWELPEPGLVRPPADNSARLGHVLAVDPDGPNALAKANEAVGRLRLRMDDGTLLPPLGCDG